jgi:hypothetical protein
MSEVTLISLPQSGWGAWFEILHDPKMEMRRKIEKGFLSDSNRFAGEPTKQEVALFSLPQSKQKIGEKHG